MKKFTKTILKVLPVVLLAVVLIGGSVFGIGTSVPDRGDGITQVDNAAKNIWATIIVIVQILAFAAIVFAGLRYMFAGADTKADIKQQTIILVAGAALVFAAEPIVTFISSVAKSIFK